MMNKVCNDCIHKEVCAEVYDSTKDSHNGLMLATDDEYCCYKEQDHKAVLLKACYDLLQKQNESAYVLNMLEQKVHYDDTECDGDCLLEDIEAELGLE